MALAEHASIGSFAVTAQKLCAAGAPAAMISEALTCAQEEIGHAELALAVARALGASHRDCEPVYRPHQVSVSGDLELLLHDTLQEGCLMETIGALEAARDCTAQG